MKATLNKENKVKLKRDKGTSKQPVFGVFIRNGEVFTEIVITSYNYTQNRPCECMV